MLFYRVWKEIMFQITSGSFENDPDKNWLKELYNNKQAFDFGRLSPEINEECRKYSFRFASTVLSDEFPNNSLLEFSFPNVNMKVGVDFIKDPTETVGVCAVLCENGDSYQVCAKMLLRWSEDGQLLSLEHPYERDGWPRFVTANIAHAALALHALTQTPTNIIVTPRTAPPFRPKAGAPKINAPVFRQVTIKPGATIERTERYRDAPPTGIVKAYHLCRSHSRRLKSGKIVVVRAHHRGDKSKGIVRKTYNVDLSAVVPQGQA